MTDRKRLSEIVSDSQRDAILRTWTATPAAADFGPIPPGDYVARVVSGEFSTSRSGTSGVKLTLLVLEPEEWAGRRLWSDHWLTPAAMPATKRDLSKLGIDDLEKLDRGFPEGLVVKCRVGLRKDDDGAERNRIVRFDLLRVEAPQENPFAPADDNRNGGVPF